MWLYLRSTTSPLRVSLGPLVVAFSLALLLTAGEANAKETIVFEHAGLHLVSEGKLVEIFPEGPEGFGVSPDGESVALALPYSSEDSGAVMILDLGTKETEVVSTPEESGIWWSQIRYAPSGEQIIGRAYDETTGFWGIYAMDTDGTDVRKLVSDGEWPVMSTQGALAFISNKHGDSDLYIVDPSTGGESAPRRLMRSDYYGDAAGRISFSPDGESILFPREKDRTYAVDVSSGKAKLLPNVRAAAEWETATTVLDGSGPLLRRNLSTLKTTLLAETTFGWVRTSQPAAEVEPPEAFEPPSCAPRSVDLIVDQELWLSLECDGPELVYELDTEPTHGEVLYFSPEEGYLGYKPEEGFVGTDTIKFHAVNEDGETDSVALTIAIHPAICEPGWVGTEEEEPLPITLPCYGPWLEPETEEGEWEPEALSFELVSAPEHGEVSGFNESTGELSYLPDTEFSGEDSLSFRATDSHGTSATATLSIMVGGAPACDDLTIHTEPGEGALVDLDCPRAVGEVSSFSVIEGPDHGEIDEFDAEDGTLVYQPDRLFEGQDSFVFRAENWAGESNEATATINVCAKPVLDVSGEAVEADVPGVDLTVFAAPDEPECEIDGTTPEVTKFVVSVDDELVYSEERQCGDVENPCGREDWERRIQLPYSAVVGTHEIRVEAEDQFGNRSKPIIKSETTPAEGTFSQLPPEAEDSKESEGCETPKNRYGRYVFNGNVVHGTPCADILVAYPKHHTEIYLGGDGDDVIRTGGEIDKIKGGTGNDQIYSGRGNDIVFGQEGDDRIVGGSGDDKIFGKSGNDNLSGTSGSDLIRGNNGDDLIRGGTTADSLLGGLDTDTLSFADAVTPGFKFGNEFIGGYPTAPEGRGIYLNLSGETQKDSYGEYIRAFNGSTARFGGGVDKVYISDGGFENVVGSAFADVIEGSSGTNLIDGSGGTDILNGAGGDDTIYGGGDSDLVDGGPEQGAKHLHGGMGDDICLEGAESEACERESTAEGLKAPSEAVSIGRLSPDDPTNDSGIYVRGSIGNDVIVATWDENGKEVDFTAKGVGFDTGANGASGCTVEAASAHCPASGIQTLLTDGGPGRDVLKAHSFPPSVSVTLTGGPGNDNLFGGPSEDILVDGPETGKDDLYGFSDDDTLLASEGLDRLFGADGADLFVSSSICEGDRIKGGGDSRDNASWAQLRGEPKGASDESEPPKNGVEVSIPKGEAGDISSNGGECAAKGHIEDVELLEGSGGPDRLEGNEGHNILLGRGGKDELFGLGAVDGILANNGDPGGEKKEEQEDPDGTLDCGDPVKKYGKDKATIGPADETENCEDVTVTNQQVQARVAGIGADPTAEAPETSNDEVVVGGITDPDAIPPIAFFRLDETSGTEAENWSDDEAPGTYEGEGVELDQQGAMEDSRGVHLDGEDDYLNLADAWNPSDFIEECGDVESGYSIEMWVKFDDEATGREELFSRAEDDEGVFLYRSADDRVNFSVADGRESPVVRTEGAVEDGEWHHVVATITHFLECAPTFAAMSLSPEEELEAGTRLTLTVDGFSRSLGLDPSSTVPSSTAYADNLIGTREGEAGPVDLLAGTVDDVAIYDRPLSEDEVQTHLLISESPEPTVVLLPPVDPEDGDTDEDGVLDSVDNCSETANANQNDGDGDGIGDACQTEPDSDEDEIPDEADNCPEETNALQEDSDENGVGDACEPE